MSVLDEINAKKREHVQAQKDACPFPVLESRALAAPEPKGFLRALENAGGPAIIAEVKKASPSKGVIREDFDPVEIAEIYEQNGATCLSVLTDEPYFQGSDDIFRDVREHVALPMLRKDFMIDPYQIYESRALGADCTLLIMAALSDSQAKELYDLSYELGMDVLVEVHNEAELERALRLNPKIVGVNNRNLKTLDVDIQNSFDLVQNIPLSVLKIAESGISDPETITNLYNSGFKGFLVGESLMRSDDIGGALQHLLSC